jgi:hypothetical protein
MSARFHAVAFVGFLVLLCSTAFGKFPLTKAFIVDPWVGSTALGTVDVAVDIHNRVHLTWVKRSPIPGDNSFRLYYRCYDASGKPLTDKMDMIPADCGVAIPEVRSNRLGQVAIAAGVKHLDPPEYLHSYWRMDSLGYWQPPVQFGLDQVPISDSPEPGLALGDSGQIIIASRNCVINNCDSLYYVMFDKNDRQLFCTRPASSPTLQMAGAMWCQVAVAPSGRFVIVWSADVLPFSWPYENYNNQPFARVFDAKGSALTDEIPVACEGYPETCSGDPAYFLNGIASGQFTDVAIQDDGDFVVAYRKDNDYNCITEYYFLRRFFADGTPKGPNVRINDKTNCVGYPPPPRIRSDSAGNLVSVFLVNTGWEEDRWDIMAQRFDSEGNRIGGNYRINDIPAEYPNGAVDLYGADVNEAGLMAVTWWEYNALAPGWNLALQTMDVSDIGYKCGDANDDKHIDVADAIYLIDYIFTGGCAPKDICLGDGSGDGVVDIMDAVTMISYIFQGGDITGKCLGQ